ncbi:ATP-dependent DNA helicase PIF7-like [Rhipicephalus microplus]|uniref:ATP-dependent DNA helicase PIF7-like n=1 Tax=Rhipicephalus microplus TaxID=6941 RepID=UPI003F6B0039
MICASTGKPAVAVGGTTVHSAFKFVRAARGNRQDARLGVMRDGGLRPSDLNTFRCAFRRVMCVIIDEVSIMSADQLKLVDCRLRQITQRLTEPFGGLDVILCGNLWQLPSVRVSEIFKRPRSAECLLGFSTVTWHHLEYYPLVRVVRQSDVTFSAVLTKIGDGRTLEPEEEAAEHAPSAVRIFYSNADVTRFNETVARSQDDFVVLRARDRYLGCKTPHLLENAKRRVAHMVPSEFTNLPGEVMAVVGKSYIMTHNIDLMDGLVNGAVGVLHLCELAGPFPDDGDGLDEEGEGDEDEETRVRRLWLEFDVPSVGKLTRARAARAVHEARSNGYDVTSENWIPIEMQSATIAADRKAGIACKWTQFPLVQASAITVHKSQRETYASVVYDYSKTHPQKLVYVALSRCTNLNGLYLTNAALPLRSEGPAFPQAVRGVDLFCLTETWNRSSGDCAADVSLSGSDHVTWDLAERRAGGVDVFLKRYRPFSERAQATAGPDPTPGLTACRPRSWCIAANVSH